MLCPLSYEDARIPILAKSRPGDYLTRLEPYLPFFVYGTLLPGQPNYDVWLPAISRMRPAELHHCRLYDLGDYPMLVPWAGGVARGMLVELQWEGYAAVVAALDYLEGIDATAPGESAYRRVRRIVRPAGNHAAVAWVYLGDPAFVFGLPAIDTDWKTWQRGAFSGANSP